MKHRLIWLLTLFILAACGPSAEELASQTAVAETQIAASWTETPTPTLTPTSTSTPTATPTPTPTETPTPTPVGFDAPGLIAFSRDTGPGVSIHVIKPSGEDEIRIAGEPGVFLAPSWSPDGELLAFTGISSGPVQIDLWVAKADGSEDARQINLGGVVIPSALSWSADSQYLVYGGSPPGSDESDVYIVEVETGEIENLTQDDPGWHDWPDWSPDGEWIVFTSNRIENSLKTGLYDIWIMKPDGSEQQNLTNQPEWEDVKPSWSPDNQQIAFFRRNGIDGAESGPSGLYVINPDGSGERLVYAFDADLGSSPAWSPDGEWIGFTNDQDVWVVSVDDEEAIQISELPGFEGDICWSPDSETLSYSNVTDDDDRTIYVAAADGSGSRLLIDDDMLEWLVDWSP